jgi:hypothetical protein
MRCAPNTPDKLASLSLAASSLLIISSSELKDLGTSSFLCSLIATVFCHHGISQLIGSRGYAYQCWCQCSRNCSCGSFCSHLLSTIPSSPRQVPRAMVCHLLLHCWRYHFGQEEGTRVLHVSGEQVRRYVPIHSQNPLLPMIIYFPARELTSTVRPAYATRCVAFEF